MEVYFAEVAQRIESTESTIPAHRRTFKSGFSFSDEPFEAQLAIWNYIWTTSSAYEMRLYAYFFLEDSLRYKQLYSILWDTARAWQDDVDDWGLCDGLAKVITKTLEVNQNNVYPQLVIWNQSPDKWKRRQSVVSLLYFSRTKKTFPDFEKIVPLIQSLLHDKEYYVQKGVGWALRELYSVYPKRAYPFLIDNILNISAIAFTISIEKMDQGKKEELKSMRRKKRIG